MNFQDMAQDAAAQIAASVTSIDPAQMAALIQALAEARRVVVHGLGREGLMMRALAMRLYHLGLDVQMLGDMATPPLGAGDLFLLSAGPGAFATLDALIDIAKTAGAGSFCITAQADGRTALACDGKMVIAAQTMANDQGKDASALPMGSLYEGAMFLTCELLVLALRDHLGVTPEQMRARHTNME